MQLQAEARFGNALIALSVAGKAVKVRSLLAFFPVARSHKGE
jgi:hypothetical protein